jgi:hypothetical protein
MLRQQQQLLYSGVQSCCVAAAVAAATTVQWRAVMLCCGSSRNCCTVACSHVLRQQQQLLYTFWLLCIVLSAEGEVMSLEQTRTVELHLSGRWLSRSVWRLGKMCRELLNIILPCNEITGYRIKYSTVLWFIELQIRRGREV